MSRSAPGTPTRGNQVGIGKPYDQTRFIPYGSVKGQDSVYVTSHTLVLRGNYQGREVLVKVQKSKITGDVEKMKSVRDFLNFPMVDFQSYSAIEQRLWEKVETWKRLSHLNVLAPLGVTIADGNLGTVSEQMDHINQFIRDKPDADRVELVGYHSCSSPHPTLILRPSDSSKASPEDWVICTTRE